MLLFKRFIPLFFGFLLLSLGSLSAQSQLNRISITERSDGNGYVVRYHLTQMVDSFDVAQPEVNRVQMQLFSSTLDTEIVEMPETNDEITDVELIDIEGGIGVDIRTGENVYFIAQSYPDQNLRDLLLSLEYTSQNEAEELASERVAFPWTFSEPEIETEQETEPEEITTALEEEPSEQTIQRRPGYVRFGFAVGIGSANKIGGSYTSDPRQKMTMGITASIDLPFILPYSIEPAIETGLFYTQKGFENPSGEKIEAQTVILDYIEVPVLAKLRYGISETVKPYGLGGFYTAFRTAAETIQNDGDRNDIGNQTNNIDWGLVAGLGSDFEFEKATVSLQARIGIGIPRLFKDGYSGGERPSYVSLLVGLHF
ncbi:MAG: porin family protein [Balneolaceae bacterium]|nr:porin family protein [Balneolaceae bacterium]